MSSDDAPEKRMITLMSNDKETFEIEEDVAAESQMLKFMMEDDCADNTIPLPNIDAKTLAKVLEYCRHHMKAAAKAAAAGAAADKAIDEETKAFDDEFVNVDQEMRCGLIAAAHYLDIKSLLDLMCQTLADMMKGKTPEEIRKIFHIENDFSPEEEEVVRRENAWAFE